MNLSEYNLVEENQDCIILMNNSDNILLVYREYDLPKYIGKKQILLNSQLIDILENRKSLQASNLLQLQDYSITSKLCLLYEQYTKNFDEELSKRRNTEQFWSEEELYNTFQACLGALKQFHDYGLCHGCIQPNCIVFSQDSQVKLADYFAVTQNFRKNYSPLPDNEEFGYWSPEILNQYNGWKQSYETIECDIWSLGIVFIEAMCLKSGYEFYFIDEYNKMHIDYQQIHDQIENIKSIYSQQMIDLIQQMLVIDPSERTWDNIIQKNNQILESHQQQRLSQTIQPIPEESEEESIIQEKKDDDKKRLLNMLESCLVKSRQLIKENENRKSKRPSCDHISCSQSTPPRERDDTNSSLLFLMKGKYGKKNSIDYNSSILKEIPQNKQKQRQNSIQEQTQKITLTNNQQCSQIILDPNDLSNLSQIYKSYKGDGINKTMHGKGHLIFQNGAVLQGSFKNGKVNGYGILVANGEMIIAYWEDNILVQTL